MLKSRDELKDANNNEFARDLSAIRADLKALISKWNETGYKYTGSVYREIAMENSNYGGMY